jgi:hypothetical protein
MEAKILQNLRLNNIPTSSLSIITSYYFGFRELVRDLILQLNVFHAQIHIVFRFESVLDLNTETIAFEGFSFFVSEINRCSWNQRKSTFLDYDIKLFNSDQFGLCSFQELCEAFDDRRPSGNLEFDIHTFPDGGWYYCYSCPKCRWKMIM